MSREFAMVLDPSCRLCLTSLRGGSRWSPLRGNDTSSASSSPRNFADEPATWYDFAISSARIGTHDYTRELIVRINDTDGIIWGDGSWQAVFYAMRSGQSVLVCMQPGTANYARSAVSNVAAGIHTITWRKTGNSASYSFDGSELFSVPAVTGNTQWTTRAIPRSTTGTILSDTLRDETSGRIVWNYPNTAERPRLITKTNVRTDRGAFEAAEASLAWSVKSRTAQPDGNLTLIIDLDAAHTTGGAGLFCTLGGSDTVSPFRIYSASDEPGFYITGLLLRSQSGAIINAGNFRDAQSVVNIRRRTTIAVAINFAAHTIKFYDAGELKATQNLPAAAVALHTGENIMAAGGITANLQMKIYSIMLYHRELAAAEIARPADGRTG